MWWLIFPAIVVVFLLVLIIRALCFKPAPDKSISPSGVDFDKDAAVEHLSKMIRMRTVSYPELEKEDESQFEGFRALLPELYPTVYEKCELERLGRTGILLKLKGRGDGQPSVFMAHYDVVPADEASWKEPPFEAKIVDGELWGRGALDTKITLLGVMESAETLLKQGFVPENDVYLAFAGDEETLGTTAGDMAKELDRRGIHPAFVLDEGGAVVENVFPGVKERCALIGIAEKGPMNMEFSIDGAGGHASTPPSRSNVGRLADAVSAIETHPFKYRLSKPIAEMFDVLGRRSTFVYRLIFSNLWCFLPVLDSMCRKQGGEMNAMLRTTCAFTHMKGSDAYNVLPPRAEVGANLRIMTGESIESVTKELEKRIKDKDIKLRLLFGMSPSPCSRTDCDAYEKLTQAIKETWTDAIVSPYLMLACSDSRHYSEISEYVYRFSAMALSKEQRGLIHGNNERIPIDTIHKTVEFYIRIMSMR